MKMRSIYLTQSIPEKGELSELNLLVEVNSVILKTLHIP